MTLHEAIEKLLRQMGRPMTTQQIADELNKNGWYQKKDSSEITAFQIHGRTKNYSNIFDRNGSMVYLIEQKKTKSTIIDNKTNVLQQIKLTSTHSKTSFPPISNPNTEILILGTLPGEKSLELAEYYGHPRNRFWKIVATITNDNLPITYEDKKQLLIKHNIGVWDVAHKAIRKGSLDSAIESEEPNDLNTFISEHRNLKVIGFNGLKSKSLYDKYFNQKTDIKYITLPSSSPANAGISFEQICKAWAQLINNSF